MQTTQSASEGEDFWTYYDAVRQAHTDWTPEDWYVSGRSEVKRGADILARRVKGAEHLVSIATRNCSSKEMRDVGQPLILELMLDLAYGCLDPDNSSPSPQRYLSENITVYPTSDFKEVLKTSGGRRGSITFFWNCFDEDGCFICPQEGERLASFLYRWTENVFDDDDGDNYDTSTLSGGAIGFITGKKLEIYPLPSDWFFQLECVRQEPEGDASS